MATINEVSAYPVRRPVARVRVFWGGSLLDNIAVSTNETTANYIHRENPATFLHVADGVTSAGQKWFHLDGLTRLDSMKLMPSTAEGAALNQVGWFGSVLSDASGNFATEQTLIVRTPQRPIQRLDLYGNDKYAEYPVDFTVRIYSGFDAGTLRYTNAVTGNASNHWFDAAVLDGDGDPIYDASRIEVAITKWSAANAVCKIVEFATLASEVYDGDEIMSLSVLEEMEIKDATLPTGNVSSNELELSLNNVDDKFFPQNTNAPFHMAIRPGRKIVVEIGFDIPSVGEVYVPFGTYWSGDWKMSEMGTVASTTARDRMERLRNSLYKFPGVILGSTIGDLAEMVLDSAKATQLDLTYTVDPALYNAALYTVPVAFGEKGDSYFDILKRLAEACIGRCYVDRTDVIRFEIPKAKTAYEYAVDMDNYFDKTFQADTESVSNVVQVTAVPMALTGEASDSLFRSKSPEYMVASSTREIIVEYQKNPVPAASFTFDTTPESDDVGFVAGFAGTMTQKRYSWGAKVLITCTTTGSFRIVATGQHYATPGKTVVEVQDQDSIFEYTEKLFELKENGLIQQRELAEEIANRLIDTYKNPARDIELDWRGNPNVGLDNVLELPEYQKGAISVNGEYLVYKNKTSFDGTLRMNSTMRKVSVDVIEAIQDTDSSGDDVQDTDNSSIIIQG